MHTTTTNELFLVGFLSFVIAQHAYTTVKSKMVKILMGSSEVAFFKAVMPVTVSGFEIFAKRFGASRHPGKPSERLETAHFSLI